MRLPSRAMVEPHTYNLADQWEAVADRVGDREAVVCGGRRLTYAQLEERANRLANHLSAEGVGPGDLVGFYLTNSTEYLETLLACFKLRAVPVNVNYRYVADELRYLFDDAGLVAVVCQQQFGPRVAEIAGDVPTLRHTLVVADDSGLDPSLDRRARRHRLRRGAGRGAPDRPVVDGRGDDDLYVIYTGGTTGMPKGVVWRMGDAFFGCIGGGDPMRLNGPVGVAGGDARPHHRLRLRLLRARPAHARRGPVGVVHVAAVRGQGGAAHRAVRPRGGLAHHRARRRSPPPPWWATPWPGRCATPGTSTAPTTSRPCSRSPTAAPRCRPGTKARLQSMLPDVMLTDGFGSSETGIQGSQRLEPGADAGAVTRFDNVDGRHQGAGRVRTGRSRRARRDRPGRPHRVPAAAATTTTRRRPRRPSSRSTASATSCPATWPRWRPTAPSCCWAAARSASTPAARRSTRRRSRACSRATPPCTTCWSSACPTSAGASRSPRSSSRRPAPWWRWRSWCEHCRGQLAGYKLPRDVVVVDAVVRSPAGKADYRWARTVAAEG